MFNGTVLIAIVLIGGYLYVHNTPEQRYQFRRATGWHSYFHVAAWGILFAFIAWVLLTLLGFFELLGFLHNLKNGIAAHSPTHIAGTAASDEINFLALCFLTLFLPLAWCKIIRPIYQQTLDGISTRNYSAESSDNWKAERQEQALLHIVRSDPLEYILATACIEHRQIMFSLGSRKFYIGFIAKMPPFVNGKIEYLKFVPLISGYRDKDTLRTTMTTNYDDVFSDTETQIDNEKIISCENIEDISFFDPDIYEKFEAKKAEFQEAVRDKPISSAP